MEDSQINSLVALRDLDGLAFVSFPYFFLPDAVILLAGFVVAPAAVVLDASGCWVRIITGGGAAFSGCSIYLRSTYEERSK